MVECKDMLDSMRSDSFDDLPDEILLDCGLIIVLTTLHSMLMLMSGERHDIIGINQLNRNRNMDSFSEEECWHNLRFRKPDIHRLYTITGFPAVHKMREWHDLSRGRRLLSDAVSYRVSSTSLFTAVDIW